MRKTYFLLLFLCGISIVSAQQDTTGVVTISLPEFLDYVKEHHPVALQNKLLTTKARRKITKARGAFDPKIELDYQAKEFKKKQYYTHINTALKIPTWYGVSLKASYDKNSGVYLNPEYKTPEDGLYSAGVSLNLAKGFWIDKRMAVLKQAKLYRQQTQEKQKVLQNQLIETAIDAYLKWQLAYQKKQVYTRFLANAKTRQDNVRKSFLLGDKPAIDTLEASITYQSRLVSLEKATLACVKARLYLSNFLWKKNRVPLELQPYAIPDTSSALFLDTAIKDSQENPLVLEKHPKLQAMEFARKSMAVEKRLQINNLLPKITLHYNFLASTYRDIPDVNPDNYKAALQFVMPLFLRKERAKLALTRLKQQDIDLDIAQTKLTLQNKIQASKQTIVSYQKQTDVLKALVTDYGVLVAKEEKRFFLGDGSLFLINYREVKSLETALKHLDTQYKLSYSKLKLLAVLNRFIF